jgi:hypothetical protein
LHQVACNLAALLGATACFQLGHDLALVCNVPFKFAYASSGDSGVPVERGPIHDRQGLVIL